MNNDELRKQRDDMTAGFFINFVLFMGVGVVIALVNNFFEPVDNLFEKAILFILYVIAILIWLVFAFRFFKFANIQQKMTLNTIKNLLNKRNNNN